MEGEEGDVSDGPAVGVGAHSGASFSTVGGALGLSNLGLALAAAAFGVDVQAALQQGGVRGLANSLARGASLLSDPQTAIAPVDPEEAVVDQPMDEDVAEALNALRNFEAGLKPRSGGGDESEPTTVDITNTPDMGIVAGLTGGLGGPGGPTAPDSGGDGSTGGGSGGGEGVDAP